MDSDGLFNSRFVVFRIILRFQSRFRSAYQADRWQDKDAFSMKIANSPSSLMMKSLQGE